MTEVLHHDSTSLAAAAKRMVARGLWDRATMPERCDQFAADHPAATALVDGKQRYTWHELKKVSDGLAASLVRLGLQRGERVLVQLPGGCAEVIARLAIKKAGLLGAYAPAQWRDVEMAEALRRLSPAAVIMPLSFKGNSAEALLERLRSAAPRPRYCICLDASPPRGWLALLDLLAFQSNPAELESLRGLAVRFNEVSNITSSSGSTGLPKLCAWQEGAQLALARGIADRLQLTAADNVGIFSPIAGGGGLMLWVCMGLVPCKYVVAGDYTSEALLSLIEQERITVIATVPAILARLAQAPDMERYDLQSLKAIRIGAAAVNPELARIAEERLGCVVLQAAGTMETGCFAQVALDDAPSVRHSGTVGRPLLGSQARVVDDDGLPLPSGKIGELQIWSAYAAAGYVGEGSRPIQGWDPDDPGCWFSTGDLAQLDAVGRLFIVGRRKEVINRSGLKVFPVEVERVIAEHPSVEEAAVAGVPDPVYGEVPWAFVLPRSGAQARPAELEAHVRAAGLASFKIPARFVVVDELPRVSGTKVSKARLLELYAPEASATADEIAGEAT